MDLGELVIDAAHASWYLELQMRISKLIPNEARRPVFKIDFVHGKQPCSKRMLVCGGMGPISDGELLVRVFTNVLSSSSSSSSSSPPPFLLQLLSIPPPRTFFSILTRGPTYLYRVRRFLHSAPPLANVYLASNTAHVHLNALRRLGGGSAIVDLSEHVAAFVLRLSTRRDAPQTQTQTPLSASSSSSSSSSSPPPLSPPVVLVVGTTQARRNSLYERRLQSHGGLAVVSPTPSEQSFVQRSIDETKANGELEDGGKGLFDMIVRRATTATATAATTTTTTTAATTGKEEEGRKAEGAIVLLGCTELPIALRHRIKELEDLGFTVVDTEKVFARIMADDLMMGGVYDESPGTERREMVDDARL